MEEHQRMIWAIVAKERLTGFQADVRVDELQHMSTEEVQEIYEEVIS